MKLQQRHSELEQKYTRAIATSGNASADHFVSRLLRMVADLYDKSLYRFDWFDWFLCTVHLDLEILLTCSKP